ncbi:NUDIX domain-containing protein [bacterium]|nr:NUDIX domain-containing protein [bacterium]
MKMGPDVPNCYYRVSVKALITNEHNQLLVVRERDSWDMPGGGLEWGEDLHSALRREIREELGCDAVIEAQPILIVPAINRTYQQQALWIIYRAKLSTVEILKSYFETNYIGVDEFAKSDPAEETWSSPVDFFDALKKILDTKY